MKVEWINPFIESVYTLCGTMLSCTVERGALAVSSRKGNGTDITALIGLSGPARGMVALSFPTPTARAMVGRLLSLNDSEIDEQVGDGVAELVNIVAGSAKAKFSNGKGSDVISLGLPTVVHAGSEMVEYPSQTTWLDVPFASDLGPFSLRVTFEMDTTRGGSK